MSDQVSRPEPVACYFEDSSATRREFLTRMRGAAAVTLASAAVTSGSSAKADQGPAGSVDGGGAERVLDSYQNRVQAARAETRIPVPRQMTNGDERRYSNFIGNFSKGLQHNSIGEVIPAAYSSLVNALGQGTAAAFEQAKQVMLGGSAALVNPLAGLAFDLEGTDSHQLRIDPAPAVASQERADEAVELYWMALCRDINFTEYGSNTPGGKLAQAAAAELSWLPAFSGPRPGGVVTPQTLFRGFTVGDVVGPYVSQFLLKPFDYGPYHMDGTITVAQAASDYLTDQASWLACRNGNPSGQDAFDPQRRFIRNGRDLATYVHLDPSGGLFMSFYNAGIFLFQNGAPLNPGNPYLNYKTQAPFGTFGLPFFMGLIGEAATRAFKAAWYAKWFVHRALRPEDFGGLVHMTKTDQAHYLLHPDILNSDALARVNIQNRGTYFLPQAYPEGCPQHPSYPEGHSTMAGACATILKAAFDGSASFAELTDSTIVAAGSDGLTLVDTGLDPTQITINGEINKLASNVGNGRDFAGIHWRSDYVAGVLLGEAVAISLLRDQSNNYVGEDFYGFTIKKFDGTTIRV